MDLGAEEMIQVVNYLLARLKTCFWFPVSSFKKKKLSMVALVCKKQGRVIPGACWLASPASEWDPGSVKTLCLKKKVKW